MEVLPNDGPEGGSHVGIVIAAMGFSLLGLLAGATVGGYVAMRRYGRPPKYEFPPREPIE
jgi:hypothetical protein